MYDRSLSSRTAVSCGQSVSEPLLDDEDLPDEEEAGDEAPDVDEAAELGRQALALEEKADIEGLLARIRQLPPDTKLARLQEVLAELRGAGFRQAMVFTGYTDTMDFLREQIAADPTIKVMCFSGRGGEVRDADGSWRRVSRDEVKRRFREGMADVLLCTDAAAEGLNFQFCGALINYDMPWNPMRVEQRIGRIDRLGQKFETVRIINLHYEGTIETDVYMALRERIGLFQSVVGRLQPILAKLPSLIAESALKRRGEDARRSLADQVGADADRAKGSGFDIDAVTDRDLVEPPRPTPPLTMDDLDLLLHHPDALPPGISIQPLGHRQYALTAPGMLVPVRISTNPGFVEEHPDNVELWSPCNPLFPTPEVIAEPNELPVGTSVKSLVAMGKPMENALA